MRVLVQQDHPDGFHVLRDARVAAVASDYWGTRVALTTKGTACESTRADDELGLVSIGFEELGVDVRLVARKYTVFALGVLDDFDVCQKAVSVA